MGVNRRILPGVGEADVYDDLGDIPYNLLAQGGTFYCLNVPTEMNKVGNGMGALSQEQFLSGGGTGPSYLQPGEIPNPDVHWIIAYFLPYVALVIGTICAVVFVQALANFVYTIKAAPEGEVKQEFPDGSVLWEAGDGSSWILKPDGTQEMISGPTDIITKVFLAGIVVVAIVVGIWAFFRFGPKLKPKKVKTREKASPS